jgi:hypothetical protein
MYDGQVQLVKGGTTIACGGSLTVGDVVSHNFAGPGQYLVEVGESILPHLFFFVMTPDNERILKILSSLEEACVLL